MTNKMLVAHNLPQGRIQLQYTQTKIMIDTKGQTFTSVCCFGSISLRRETFWVQFGNHSKIFLGPPKTYEMSLLDTPKRC